MRHNRYTCETLIDDKPPPRRRLVGARRSRSKGSKADKQMPENRDRLRIQGKNTQETFPLDEAESRELLS